MSALATSLVVFAVVVVGTLAGAFLRGVDSEAEAVLRSGIAKVPNGAALHHALGLVLVRRKRSGGALTELAESAQRYVKQLRELGPENAEYAQMAKQFEAGAAPVTRLTKIR